MYSEATIDVKWLHYLV